MHVSRALEFLLQAQNPDGGWGYKPGGMSFVEPTAAVILVLSQDVQTVSVVQRARLFLKQLQRADGGWGISAVDDESGWMSAWAVWALAAFDAQAAQQGGAWLLDHSGLRVTDPKQIERTRQVLKIDATIAGWAWQRGDASWIFPTALSLLALYAAKLQNHARAQEGIQYLLDRAIAGGGWNIGNPFMVTGSLSPTVENTALALLALDAYGIQNEVTQNAANWIAQTDFTPTAFEWAWRAWYWTQTAGNPRTARPALKALQRDDGSWDGNPFTTAIAMMGTHAA